MEIGGYGRENGAYMDEVGDFHKRVRKGTQLSPECIKAGRVRNEVESFVLMIDLGLNVANVRSLHDAPFNLPRVKEICQLRVLGNFANTLVLISSHGEEGWSHLRDVGHLEYPIDTRELLKKPDENITLKRAQVLFQIRMRGNELELRFEVFAVFKRLETRFGDLV